MEHLYKYLQGKSRQELKELGEAQVSVSLKIDGTPLQVVFDEEHSPEFHSKGSSMSKPGPKLTSVDLLMNPAFYNRVESLKKAISSSSADFLDYVSIINLEIVVDNTHHLVQYDQKPSGNMYLLNAYSTNSGIIDKKFYQAIAKSIGVAEVPCVECQRGIMKRLCQFALEQGDYTKTKLDDNSWKKQINQIIGKKFLPLDKDVEGIVITIESGCQKTGIQVKIDSPGFMSKFAERKNTKMTDNEEKEITNVMNVAISLIDKKKGNVKKYSNDPLENLILNYNSTIALDAQSKKTFADACKSTDKSRNNAVIEAVPDKYKKYASDPDWFIGLQNFVWLFRKKRKGLLSPTNKYVDQMKVA